MGDTVWNSETQAPSATGIRVEVDLSAEVIDRPHIEQTAQSSPQLCDLKNRLVIAKASFFAVVNFVLLHTIILAGFVLVEWLENSKSLAPWESSKSRSLLHVITMVASMFTTCYIFCKSSFFLKCVSFFAVLVWVVLVHVEATSSRLVPFGEPSYDRGNCSRLTPSTLLSFQDVCSSYADRISTKPSEISSLYFTISPEISPDGAMSLLKTLEPVRETLYTLLASADSRRAGTEQTLYEQSRYISAACFPEFVALSCNMILPICEYQTCLPSYGCSRTLLDDLLSCVAPTEYKPSSFWNSLLVSPRLDSVREVFALPGDNTLEIVAKIRNVSRKYESMTSNHTRCPSVADSREHSNIAASQCASRSVRTCDPNYRCSSSTGRGTYRVRDWATLFWLLVAYSVAVIVISTVLYPRKFSTRNVFPALCCTPGNDKRAKCDGTKVITAVLTWVSAIMCYQLGCTHQEKIGGSEDMWTYCYFLCCGYVFTRGFLGACAHQWVPTPWIMMGFEEQQQQPRRPPPPRHEQKQQLEENNKEENEKKMEQRLGPDSEQEGSCHPSLLSDPRSQLPIDGVAGNVANSRSAWSCCCKAKSALAMWATRLLRCAARVGLYMDYLERLQHDALCCGALITVSEIVEWIVQILAVNAAAPSTEALFVMGNLLIVGASMILLPWSVILAQKYKCIMATESALYVTTFFDKLYLMIAIFRSASGESRKSSSAEHLGALVPAYLSARLFEEFQVIKYMARSTDNMFEQISLSISSSRKDHTRQRLKRRTSDLKRGLWKLKSTLGSRSVTSRALRFATALGTLVGSALALFAIISFTLQRAECVRELGPIALCMVPQFYYRHGIFGTTECSWDQVKEANCSGQLTNLNELRDVPELYSSMSQLSILDISDNVGLRDLPESLTSLTNLASLNLQRTGVHRLNPLFCNSNHFASLTHLSVEGAPLKTVLNMSNFSISTFQISPLCAAEFRTSVTTLDLSFNKLSSATQYSLQSVNELSALKSLLVHSNNISELLSFNQILQSIFVRGGHVEFYKNPIKKIVVTLVSGDVKEAWMKVLLEIIGTLEILHITELADANALTLTEVFNEARKLKFLQYRNLGLQHMPAGLCNVTSLTKLFIRHESNLVELPPCLNRLTNLQGLDIRYMNDSKFDFESLCRLSPISMKALYMTDWYNFNSSWQPCHYEAFKNLVDLKLEVFTRVPATLNFERAWQMFFSWIGDNLKQLTQLQLGRMGIQKLPPSVAKLPKLHRLTLDANSLSSLPFNFTTSLRHLSLHSNPLREIPASLVQIAPRLTSLSFGCWPDFVPCVDIMKDVNWSCSDCRGNTLGFIRNFGDPWSCPGSCLSSHKYNIFTCTGGCLRFEYGMWNYTD